MSAASDQGAAARALAEQTRQRIAAPKLPPVPPRQPDAHSREADHDRPHRPARHPQPPTGDPVKTKPRTFDYLIAEYAAPIAEAVGITLDADDRTEAGFTDLLSAVINRISPAGYERECLTEALDVLRAVQHLGDGDTKTRKRLLGQADRLLYDANEDLQLV